MEENFLSKPKKNATREEFGQVRMGVTGSVTVYTGIKDIFFQHYISHTKQHYLNGVFLFLHS